MRFKKGDIIEIASSNVKQPEYLLWLAVVLRALYDYCELLDRKEEKKNKKPEPFLYSATWFLFSEEIKEHNLNWISLMLYGSLGFADRVRKQAKLYETKENRKKHCLRYIRRNDH